MKLLVINKGEFMKKSKRYEILRNANLVMGLGLIACVAVTFPILSASVGIGLTTCLMASSLAYTCCLPLACHHFCLKYRRQEREAEVRQVEGERFSEFTAKDYASTKQVVHTKSTNKTQISAKENDVEVQR